MDPRIREPLLRAEQPENHGSPRDVFNAKVTQAVTAGDSTYDLVMNTMVCTMPISTKGVFLDGKLGSQPRKHGRSDAL